MTQDRENVKYKRRLYAIGIGYSLLLYLMLKGMMAGLGFQRSSDDRRGLLLDRIDALAWLDHPIWWLDTIVTVVVAWIGCRWLLYRKQQMDAGASTRKKVVVEVTTGLAFLYALGYLMMTVSYGFLTGLQAGFLMIVGMGWFMAMMLVYGFLPLLAISIPLGLLYFGARHLYRSSDFLQGLFRMGDYYMNAEDVPSEDGK